MQCSTRSPDGHTCSSTQTDGDAAGVQLHAAASRQHRTAHPPRSMATHLAAPQGAQTVHPELLSAAVAHFPDRPQQRPQVDSSHRRLAAQRARLVQHRSGRLGGCAEGMWAATATEAVHTSCRRRRLASATPCLDCLPWLMLVLRYRCPPAQADPPAAEAPGFKTGRRAVSQRRVACLLLQCSTASCFV